MTFCKYGHDKDTVGSNKRGRCRACISVWMRRWYLKHKEEHKARTRARYRINPEPRRAYERRNPHRKTYMSFWKRQVKESL